MNAAPELQLRLLDLQDLDAALDRLAQRRRTLPEIAEIARIEARLEELADEVVRVQTEAADVAREQRKAEDDVDVVRQRMVRDQQRLDTGAVSSPKELESLQHEVHSLQRRQADLEDGVLEVMERKEAIDAQLSALRAEVASLETALAESVSARDTTFAEIDGDSAARRVERDGVAAELAAAAEDLLALYEKLRASSDGVGAAPVHRARCEGCHLGLGAADLSRIKAAAPDEVLRCEECRRILVRRADSGLD